MSPPCPALGRKFLSLALLLLLLIGLASPATAADKRYSFGVMPQLETAWQPILAEIADLAGIRLELDTSTDRQDFEKKLFAGKFDFAYLDPYQLIIAHHRQGYQPLVHDLDRTLSGIIVVRKDSPIRQANDLNGKTVAFPSPNDLAATLIPRAELARLTQITVTPHYLTDEGAVYDSVVAGRDDAGGGNQETLDQQPPQVREQLRLIHQTAKVSAPPLAVHPRIPKDDYRMVMGALLALGRSEAGRSLLAGIPFTKIGATSLRDYENLTAMGIEKIYVPGE